MHWKIVDRHSGVAAYGFRKKFSHPVCVIAPQRPSLNLLFSAGTQLEDPKWLVSGSGKMARHVKIFNEEDANHPGCQHDL